MPPKRIACLPFRSIRMPSRCNYSKIVPTFVNHRDFVTIQTIVKTFHLFLLTLFFTVSLTDSIAQKEKKKLKKADVVRLNDSLTYFSQSDIFDFSNVNKVPNYYDAAKFKKIHQLDNGQHEEELYKVLREYVAHFGIENFSKNMPMMWRLAQLSSKYGPPGEAILLYKLVLKHHQQGININDLYAQYDSLELDKKKYYVALDFYYTLVNLRKEIDTLQPPHAVLQNMGEPINSLKEDYGPTIGNVD